MAPEIILGYTSSLDLVSLQYMTVVAFLLTYTGRIDLESCAERRMSDSGKEFAHEFDLIQMLYPLVSILVYIVSSLVSVSYNMCLFSVY